MSPNRAPAAATARSSAGSVEPGPVSISVWPKGPVMR